jgi:threonine aldolase
VSGDKATIARVFRFRKMFGGAMRQAGILAAAALYALEHHRERLVEDHENASRLAQGIAGLSGLTIPMPVETNMVFVDVDKCFGTGAEVCARLKAEGVWALPTASQRVRMVCHLDVTRAGIERAIAAWTAIVGSREGSDATRESSGGNRQVGAAGRRGFPRLRDRGRAPAGAS